MNDINSDSNKTRISLQPVNLPCTLYKRDKSKENGIDSWTVHDYAELQSARYQHYLFLESLGIYTEGDLYNCYGYKGMPNNLEYWLNVALPD